MSRLTTFSSPFLLGFDDIERVLDRVSKAANDGYPPYNIERLASGPIAATCCGSPWRWPASPAPSST